MEPLTNQDRLNRLEWERPENWTNWGVWSELDTRIWVPKRNPALGSTVNLAHRSARLTLIGLFTVPLAMVLLIVLLAIVR
jgi:uncharacterized protein DUF5808